MAGRMGKSRNIFLVWFVWPLITLGIYHVVWWYKINREARDLHVGIEVNPAISVVAITIGALIIVPPWVSIFNTGDRIARMQSEAGMPASCSGLLGLIASFFLGLHALYYQNELNKLWTYLGGAPEGTVVMLPKQPGPTSPGQDEAAA
jgi:hypothetical protein